MSMTTNIDEVIDLSVKISVLRDELKPYRDRLAELAGLEEKLHLLMGDTPASNPVVKRSRPRGDNGPRIMQALRDSEDYLTYTELLRRSGVPRSSFHKFLVEALHDGLIVKTSMGTYMIKNKDKPPVAVLRGLDP